MCQNRLPLLLEVMCLVLNEDEKVLLIKRADNGFWALPGGTQDLGETSQQCAEREMH